MTKDPSPNATRVQGVGTQPREVASAFPESTWQSPVGGTSSVDAFWSTMVGAGNDSSA